MGVVVDPWSTDVHSRGMLDHPFFFGVAVETDDRAQPASDRGVSLAAVFEIVSRAFDVDPPDVEQLLVVLPAPDPELAQIQCVRLTGEAAVIGEESERRRLLEFGEHRLIPLDGGHDRTGHGRTSRIVAEGSDHGAAGTSGRWKLLTLRQAARRAVQTTKMPFGAQPDGSDAGIRSRSSARRTRHRADGGFTD